MMRDGFIAASANIDELEPEAGDLPIVRGAAIQQPITLALSNSFGFGGTNAVLALRRFDS